MGGKKRMNACVFPKRSSRQKDDGEHTLPPLKLKMSKSKKKKLAWYKNKILWPDLFVSRKCTQIQGPSQLVSSGNIWNQWQLPLEEFSVGFSLPVCPCQGNIFSNHFIQYLVEQEGWLEKRNTADLNELQAEGDKNVRGRGTHFNTAWHDLANVSVLISPSPDGNGHKVVLLSRETGNSYKDSALAEKTTPRTCSYLSDWKHLVEIFYSYTQTPVQTHVHTCAHTYTETFVVHNLSGLSWLFFVF